MGLAGALGFRIRIWRIVLTSFVVNNPRMRLRGCTQLLHLGSLQTEDGQLKGAQNV